jgi:hypothetical protein
MRAKLPDIFERYAVDSGRWSMLRSRPGDLGSLTGGFGIKYKQLHDGEFSHTTRIILHRREGTQIVRSEQFGRHDPAYLEVIKSSLR